MTVFLAVIAIICFAYLLARMFSIIVHSTSKEPLEDEAKALLDKRQNEDFEWFLENYEGLFEQYGDCYLLIRNKRVICTCDSYAEGVKKGDGLFERGTYIVQHCNGDESGYTTCVF